MDQQSGEVEDDLLLIKEASHLLASLKTMSTLCFDTLSPPFVECLQIAEQELDSLIRLFARNTKVIQHYLDHERHDRWLGWILSCKQSLPGYQRLLQQQPNMVTALIPPSTLRARVRSCVREVRLWFASRCCHSVTQRGESRTWLTWLGADAQPDSDPQLYRAETSHTRLQFLHQAKMRNLAILMDPDAEKCRELLRQTGRLWTLSIQSGQGEAPHEVYYRLWEAEMYQDDNNGGDVSLEMRMFVREGRIHGVAELEAHWKQWDVYLHHALTVEENEKFSPSLSSSTTSMSPTTMMIPPTRREEPLFLNTSLAEACKLSLEGAGGPSRYSVMRRRHSPSFYFIMDMHHWLPACEHTFPDAETIYRHLPQQQQQQSIDQGWRWCPYCSAENVTTI